jgi:hypothetical protein
MRMRGFELDLGGGRRKRRFTAFQDTAQPFEIKRPEALLDLDKSPQNVFDRPTLTK